MTALLVLALLVGSGGAYTAFALLRRSPVQKARRAAVATIASAPERASVRIAGTIAAVTTLRAPFSGRECVYWQVEVTQLTSHDRTHWRVWNRCPFTIADDTGTASVDPDRFEFDVVGDYVANERASHLPQPLLAILGELGCELTDIAQVEITEACLAIGDRVDVVARGTREPDTRPPTGERGYRDAQTTVLVFAADGFVLGVSREPVWLRPPWTRDD